MSSLLTAWWRSPSAPLAVAGAVRPDEPDTGAATLRTAVIAIASESSATTVDDPQALADLAAAARVRRSRYRTRPGRGLLAGGRPARSHRRGAVTPPADRALLEGADDLTTVTVIHATAARQCVRPSLDPGQVAWLATYAEQQAAR